MSRTLRFLFAPLVVLLALAGLQAPAHAATQWGYVATAGGTMIKTGSGLLISSQTAQSGITGTAVPNSSTQSVASVAASGVLSTGAVQTAATTKAVVGGIEIKSWGRTAGVNVLNGLITADAVTSNLTTVARPDGTQTVTGGTQFVGIKIAGVNLPLNIPRNYTVSIPGIATVTLNAYASGTQGGASATQGWALGVALLKAQGDVPAGATIIVNPVYQSVVPAVPSEALFSGHAYGSKVQAKVGDGITAEVPETAMLRTPPGGSNGATLKNTTAGVNVAGLITTGAVESTSTSSTFGPNLLDADVRNTNQTARVNVLGGLVTADAVKVTAHNRRVGGVCSGDAAMTLVNLKVGGTSIPINVSPNTTIKVGDLATVIVNQQVRQGCSTLVRGVYITLLKPQGDLPVGAIIEVAKATTTIH